MNLQIDLANRFIDELSKKNSVILQVGVRYSSKTTLGMAVLNKCIRDTLFDEYHLVIPTFKYQRNNTFNFMNGLSTKDSDRITVYEDFSLQIIERLVRTARPNKNVFFYLDDCSSFIQLFSQSSILKKLIVEARHLRISTWLTSHSLKSTISPLIRANTSYFLLHRQSNADFLESLWAEVLSLFMDKKAFLNMCRDEMANKEFSCILIDKDRSKIDKNFMESRIIKSDISLILNTQRTLYSKNDEPKKNDEINKSTRNSQVRKPSSSIPRFKSFKAII